MAAGFAPPPQTAAGFGARFGAPPKPPKPPVPPRAGYVPGQGYQTPGGWNAAQPQGFSQGPAGADTLNFRPPPPGADTRGLPKPPTAPTAQATAPSNSATSQTSPLDSTYFANVAQHQFGVNNQVNALNQTSGYATTDLQNALAQLAQKEPLDQLAAQQGANRRGALFSTVLGQQLGKINQGYLDQQSGLANNFSRAQAGRDAQIQALLGGQPLYENQQAAAAAERASLAAQKNPAIGEPTGALVPGSGAPAAPQTPTGQLAAAIAGFRQGPPGRDTRIPAFRTAGADTRNAPKPPISLRWGGR